MTPAAVRRGSALSAAVVLAWASLLAQPEAMPDVVAVRITAVDWSSKTMDVSVVSEDGQPITTLTASDFSLAIDGEAASLADARLTSDGTESLVLGLVLDVSGSMGQAGRLTQAKAAVRKMVSELGSRDMVGLWTFNERVTLVERPTLDRSPVITAVDSLVARGNTALYDAAAEVADQIAEVRPDDRSVRRAVVVLSDGQDTRSATTRDVSADRVKATRVPVYAVALAPEGPTREYLREIAAATGGALFEAEKPESLTGIYQTVAALITRQYRIRFTAPDPGATSVGLRVTVTHGGGQQAAERLLGVDVPAQGAAPQPNAAPVLAVNWFAVLGGVGAGLLIGVLGLVTLVRHLLARPTLSVAWLALTALAGGLTAVLAAQAW